MKKRHIQFSPALLLAILLMAFHSGLVAQNNHVIHSYTHQDTLRGSNGPGRFSWDVLKYNLTVTPNFLDKTIQGINQIEFMDYGSKLIQIDLQTPLEIDSILYFKQSILFKREGNVCWVELPSLVQGATSTKGTRQSITVFYHGRPKEAVNPPWDGGWIWTRDAQMNPWMSVACQGLGASAWYPCKDIQLDEPNEGAELHIIVPDTLVGIGNGRLIDTRKMENGLICYSWKVVNPINNYTIVPYIGKYVHFSENYAGLKGNLSMDYWVLEDHLVKAKIQFADAPKMMKAFEYWFGPYPFYADGYKLVESPHLGMEHQSAIAYGNKFKNGYLGRDLSGSGWGLKWDFIIVHESGHEWFANNITTQDIADMWVHEGFTNYSEVLFTEYYFGKKAGDEYLIGLRKNIRNDVPIIADYGVNKEGSGDMYYKGANMIHLIRQIMNNDRLFRKMLMGLNKTFYHQTVTTQQIERYICQFSKIDFSKVFDQYLRTIQIPTLEYMNQQGRIFYKWSQAVPGLNMPVKIYVGDHSKPMWIRPSEDWKSFRFVGQETGIQIDPAFYVNLQRFIQK
jgi:aminopeptidase N